MAGGYNNQFSQYQALPTNLQNYTGGTGSPSLMHQGQAQQPGAGGQMPFGGGFGGGMRHPFMGGYSPFGGFGGFGGFFNPFMRSPYGFMGGMGQNWGMNYNAAAQSMTGNPPAGHVPPPMPTKQAPVQSAPAPSAPAPSGPATPFSLYNHPADNVRG